MMKFIFINPGRVISQGSIWRSINSVSPPMGIALLAAVLEEAGHSSEIIDAAALGLSDSQIIKLIPSDSNYVGITASTPEIDSATRLARKIRTEHPDIRILMGGVHPTVMHEELVAAGFCDIVVRGEGENAILEMASGMPISEIKGLTWMSEGEVIVNPSSNKYVELDKLPFPAYHKLPMHLYRSALGASKLNPSICLITSRGCPGACTFCYSSMFGTRTRYMSPERILEQIKLLQDVYGIREFSFYDDTFTADQERVEQLCELILYRNIKISWSCFARVDTVSEKLLVQMKKAGCHQVGYGIESVDQNVLAAINKRMSRITVENVITWTRNAGIDVRGLFMFGNVGDTRESMQKNLDYALSMDIQYAVFNITTPFPGTYLYKWAEERKVLKHKDWIRYDLSHVILDLDTVASESVETMYGHAYRKFYFRFGFVLDRLREIRSIEAIRNYFRVFVGIIRTAGTS